MDEILLNEPKTLSAVNHEAPEFLENGCDENDMYQVENMSLDDTKEKKLLTLAYAWMRKFICGWKSKWNDIYCLIALNKMFFLQIFENK